MAVGSRESRVEVGFGFGQTECWDHGGRGLMVGYSHVDQGLKPRPDTNLVDCGPTEPFSDSNLLIAAWVRQSPNTKLVDCWLTTILDTTAGDVFN